MRRTTEILCLRCCSVFSATGEIAIKSMATARIMPPKLVSIVSKLPHESMRMQALQIARSLLVERSACTTIMLYNPSNVVDGQRA